MSTDASTSTASRTIPYRESAEVSGGDVAWAFGAAILLLFAALGLAWLARKQGWLRRWGLAAGPDGPPGQGLRIEQVLRISPRTVIFRIVDGDRRILLAESRDGIQLLAPPAAGGKDDAH